MPFRLLVKSAAQVACVLKSGEMTLFKSGKHEMNDIALINSDHGVSLIADEYVLCILLFFVLLIYPYRKEMEGCFSLGPTLICLIPMVNSTTLLTLPIVPFYLVSLVK